MYALCTLAVGLELCNHRVMNELSLELWIATYICKILKIGSAEMISNFAIQVFDLQNELFHCLMACVNNYAKITLSKIVAECN